MSLASKTEMLAPLPVGNSYCATTCGGLSIESLEMIVLAGFLIRLGLVCALVCTSWSRDLPIATMESTSAEIQSLVVATPNETSSGYPPDFDGALRVAGNYASALNPQTCDHVIVRD